MTGYNSEYSDRPFAEKRDMKGGFTESPLRLNQGLGKLEHWTEENMRQRSERLAAQATGVWPVPAVEATILDAYRPAGVTAGYAISDHPNLATGPMHELFLEFRKQVLALDPCVTEEYLKLYVAYKAETNFVDVVPQAKRLLLVAQHGVCRDYRP